MRPYGVPGSLSMGPNGVSGSAGHMGGARVQVQFSKIILYLMTEYLQLVAQTTPNM